MIAAWEGLIVDRRKLRTAPDIVSSKSVGVVDTRK